MNTILRGITVFAFILMCGMAVADVATPQVPETQGFDVNTKMDLLGTATQQTDITWRMSSEVLGKNLMYEPNLPEDVGQGNGDWIDALFPDPENPYFPFEYVGPGNGYLIFPYWPDYDPGEEASVYSAEPPLNLREVQMANSYSELTIADQGLIGYTRSTSIETAFVAENQENIENSRILTFIGSDLGRAVSSEDILLDTASNIISLAPYDPFTCPFAKSMLGNCLPPFCNIVNAGSEVDMVDLSLASGADTRSVGEMAYDLTTDPFVWPPIPVVDGPPVTMDYSIRITGATPDSPALGSAMTYIQAHMQEGGSPCAGSGEKVQDIVYGEKTTASGEVSLFEKVLSYESGILRN